MKAVNLFLSVCLILLVVGSAQATVYTEADAYWGTVVDSGPKPYSSVDYSSSYFQMSATAEAGDDWAKGISRVDAITDESSSNANSKSISRFTTTFEVISNGLVSFDLYLDGVMEVFNSGDGGENSFADYVVTVSDSISNDNIKLLHRLAKDIDGTYIETIDITDTYNFGTTTYSSGTLIDVTLELQTKAHAGYGYGIGSYVSSDFSNSLTIGNLDNLQVLPEPASIFLLLLGGIGLRRHISEKNNRRNHNMMVSKSN